jgi:hypothetical protein
MPGRRYLELREQRATLCDVAGLGSEGVGELCVEGAEVWWGRHLVVVVRG